MAEPTGGGKRQTSLSVDGVVLESLDNWIEYQKKIHGYETDRSFIVTTLLRKFIQLNGLTAEEFKQLEELRRQTLSPKD